jgi:hypothetical protein
MLNKFNHFSFGMIICLNLILLLTMGCDIQTAKPEIHLIPQGFVGHVTLYFDAPNGLPEKWEGNTRLYEIPINGQLYTRFSPNIGIRPANSTQFFYVSSKGGRTLIPSRTVKKLLPETIVASNVYVVNKQLHYFIDSLNRIDTYKNPALVDTERQGQ